jgi:hypothetical protein
VRFAWASCLYGVTVVRPQAAARSKQTLQDYLYAILREWHIMNPSGWRLLLLRP